MVEKASKTFNKCYRRLEWFQIAQKAMQRSCKGQKANENDHYNYQRFLTYFFTKMSREKEMIGKVKLIFQQNAVKRPWKGHASQ